MTSLSEILSIRAIELNLASRRKSEVLTELAGLLVHARILTDPAPVVRELLKREKLGSTGVGEGVAIPHCAVPGLKAPAVAFGRKKDGIPFDSMDRIPVSLFFLLVVPEGSQGLHLQLLSRLARFLRNDRFRTLLLSAAGPDEVLAGLKTLESE